MLAGNMFLSFDVTKLNGETYTCLFTFGVDGTIRLNATFIPDDVKEFALATFDQIVQGFKQVEKTTPEERKTPFEGHAS